MFTSMFPRTEFNYIMFVTVFSVAGGLPFIFGFRFYVLRKLSGMFEGQYLKSIPRLAYFLLALALMWGGAFVFISTLIAFGSLFTLSLLGPNNALLATGAMIANVSWLVLIALTLQLRGMEVPRSENTLSYIKRTEKIHRWLLLPFVMILFFCYLGFLTMSAH
jgi:hypothetical protein